MSDPFDLGNYVAAVGALGTASFALVDAFKSVGGGPSNIGFGYIEEAVKGLFASRRSADTHVARVLSNLKANWINGTALRDQKAIAKSLVKLLIHPDDAQILAMATGMDKDVLASALKQLLHPDAAGEHDTDALGRFDLALTALLDDAYQRADQSYRNKTRSVAMATAIVLAVAGTISIDGTAVTWKRIGQAVLIGLLATPLAPFSKDLTSALAEAVKAMQPRGRR